MSNVLVWDSECDAPLGYATTILWRSFSSAKAPDIVSIPQLIEENAAAVRARYLAWVFELGEMRIKDRRLVDHLELRPNYSYWWMTLLVEKCNYSKSPEIDDAIRLLAFNDWAVNKSVERITLSSANMVLAESVRGWCEKSGVTFEWQRLPSQMVQRSFLRCIYEALPLVMQAWIWLLKYLMERWPLVGVGMHEWRQTPGQTTFVTYSDNCVPEAIKDGRYENRYWAHLPVALKQAARPVNWLHIYIKDGLLPTARHAASALDAFNKSAHGLQCHVTLDTFISPGVILKTVRDWFYLVRKGKHLGESLNPTLCSSLNLWPLLSEDWKKSMFGVVAIRNLLYLNLFEAALKNLATQQQGVYLQENMGWEFGFAQAWRAAGHGRLIGVPHSTVRFWDLRYFFDPRSYLRTGHNDIPLPDQVACNGPAMRATYQQGRYPAENLVDVEALRYLHLGQKQKAMETVPNGAKEHMHLLVLGDYLVSNTQLQMRLLEQAVLLISQFMHITVKPHPNCPIQAADYPNLHMRVSEEPIAKLLSECDVAYASAATSAALDAFCAGVPVISVIDANTLNLSPLRGCEGVVFACNPKELALALTSVISDQNNCNTDREFFSTNSDLPKWQRLLLV